MRYDFFVKDASGYSLEVLQDLPDKGEKFPTILMVPGFDMDLHEYGLFDQISDILVRNGFQTFRFSFSGSGKSQGDFSSMTLDSQVRQLRDIINYVVADRFTIKEKIGLLGQSFGAVTIIASLPIPEVTSFIFLSASAHPLESIAARLKRQRRYQPEGISQLSHSDKRITKIGPNFWKNLAKYNFVGNIRKMTQPVLLFYGSKDKVAKLRDAHEYYEAITARKRLHIIKQANHAFTGKYRPKLLELILEWLEDKFR